MPVEEPEVFALVKAGDVDALRSLLQRDASAAAARGRQQRTPLIVAAEHGDEETVRALLGHGADVAAVDSDGKAALHHAMAEGWDIVTLDLLRHRADLSQGDAEGDTPVHWAARMATDEALRVAQLALSPDEHDPAEGDHVVSDADVAAVLSARNRRGELPLHIAASEADAEPLVVWMVAAARRLLSAPAFGGWLGTVAVSGTALHLACDAGSARVAAVLASAGAGAAAPARDGATPLHAAVKGGSADVVELLLTLDSSAAYLDRADAEGATALHHAARDGRAALLRVLLSAGAACDVATKAGVRPIQLAHQHRHGACVELLRGAGASADGVGDTAPAQKAARAVQRGSAKGQQLAEEAKRAEAAAAAKAAQQKGGGGVPLPAVAALLLLLLFAAWALRGGGA